jgi:hypothetical protein
VPRFNARSLPDLHTWRFQVASSDHRTGFCTMILAATGFLLGSVFGLIFRAWVLAPLTAAAVVGITGTELAADVGIVSALAFSSAAALAVQIGYGAGLLARNIGAASRDAAVQSPQSEPIKRAQPT